MRLKILPLLLLPFLSVPDAKAATVVFEFKAQIVNGAWDLSGTGGDDVQDLSGALLTVTGTTISDVDSAPGDEYGIFQTQLSFTVDGFGTLAAEAGDFHLLQIQNGAEVYVGFQQTGFIPADTGPGLVFSDLDQIFFANPSLLEDVGSTRIESIIFSGLTYVNSSNQFLFLTDIDLTLSGNNVSILAVPEPSAYALLALGLALLALLLRHRKLCRA